MPKPSRRRDVVWETRADAEVTYENLDVDTVLESNVGVLATQGEGLTGVSGQPAPGADLARVPVSTSWTFWHVKVPASLAVTSMVCIVIYLIIAVVAMGVRKLRWEMVNWLMYVLLVINALLLLSLAAVVAIAKTNVNLKGVLKYADGSRAAKHDYA